MIQPYYDENDKALDSMLGQLTLSDGIDFSAAERSDKVNTYKVIMPDSEYGFLHEAAIISFRGVLYASWYNCPQSELKGHTPVRGKRSYDGGKTWSGVETIADDPSGKLIYCPPVYGICRDRLYMLINEMVGADRIHALDLYILNGETDKFEFVRSLPIPFKLNTNVYTLPNGKLLLPGRIAEPDGFPNTPAVLISDSGEIDAEWRLVRIQPDGSLPDGSHFEHPELSAVIDGETVYIFSRDDERRVPLLYASQDCGEHWSPPLAHDLPFSSSKIYSGTLSDGRNYVIGNLYPGRSKLALFLSEPGKFRFSREIILQDGSSPELGFGELWHYPVACEADGKLYIIYTVSVDAKKNLRGAVVSVVDLF